MVKYLKGEKTGLPKLEAIEILDLIQIRGCSLRGTEAERALEEFVGAAPSDSLESLYAKSALDAIRRDIIVRNGPDGLRGGPCRPGK